MLNLSPSEPLDESPFRLCRSIAELTVVGELVVGRKLTMFALNAVQAPRQLLQNAARELRRAGRKELADLVAEMAKQAPKAPWWRGPRRPGKWRTASAQVYIDRRKADRRAEQAILVG